MKRKTKIIRVPENFMFFLHDLRIKEEKKQRKKLTILDTTDILMKDYKKLAKRMGLI